MRQLWAVVVLLLVAAACGGGSDTAVLESTAEATTTAVSATTTAEATTTAAPAPVSTAPTGTTAASATTTSMLAPTTLSLADRFSLTREAILAGDMDLMECAVGVFGLDRMIEFSQGEDPTNQELILSEPCLIDPDDWDEEVRDDDGEREGGGSVYGEWSLASQVDGAECPVSDVNHAAVGSFDWRIRPILSGEVANFAVSPSSPNVVYMGIEVNAHSVYRSDDYGETWTVLHRFDHAKDTAVHPTDPNIAFHADSTGVWRTSTGLPESYTQVVRGGSIGPPQAAFPTVVVSPSNPDVVYTAQKGDDAPNGILDGGVVYRSTDGGRSFSKIARHTPVVNVLAVDPGNTDRLLLGSNDGVYESLDGGVSWKMTTGGRALGKVIDIKTLDGEVWYGATGLGVARSTDGGRTWSVSSQGLPGPLVQRIGVVRDAPHVVWATTRSGVVRSMDGGETFDDVSGFGRVDGLPAVNLQALGVWPEDPDMALVSTNSLVYSARSDVTAEIQGQLFGQGIFKTSDGGRSWRRVAIGVAETTIIEIQTNPLRPTEVWAGQQASRGIFRSRDAGQSWSQSNTLLTHYPMKMAFVPGHPDRLVFTSSHPDESFGLTTDSGLSWLTRSEQTFFDIIDKGLELFDEGLRFGGNLHLHGVAVAPDDPNYILVGSVNDPSQFSAKPLTGSHIYRSTDGGATWAESMDGYDYLGAVSIHDIVFDPIDPDRVYLGTTGQESVSGNGLWRSSDRGRTWDRSDNWTQYAAHVNEVVTHPTDGRSLVAATGDGLYVSTDRGDSWVRTHDSYAWDVEADLANPGVVYAGTIDGVLLSSDFGKTWQDITPAWLDPDAHGWGMVGVLQDTGATSVGVSCDGAITYAAFAGVGMAVSVAPGYVAIPEDPDQVSRMSGRAIAGMYDKHLHLARATQPTDVGSTSGESGGQPAEQDSESANGQLGPLAGLPGYAIACVREQLGGAWDDLEAGRPATSEEEALITACVTSGGDLERIPDVSADPGPDGQDPNQGDARLQDLPESVKDCIRSQLPPVVWDQLWGGRPANPGEQGLIDGCEASGGISVRNLPEPVKNCIRSQLQPGVWDQLWGGRPANPGEQGLIDGCEATGGTPG